LATDVFNIKKKKKKTFI